MSATIAIVTGASSGIGLATADALARAGARVVVASRSPSKGERALQRLSQPDRAAVGTLDLADRASVHAFARWFGERHDHLDLLISNAGVMATPATLTADGVELQWATNHLGHFLLTGLLIDHLRATPGSRIVTVSSLAANSGNLDDHDPTSLAGYTRFGAYARSKLANLVFTVELERRLRASSAPAMALAAHPGIAHSNLASGLGHGAATRMGRVVSRIIGQPAHLGARPTLRAATDPGAQGGQWFGPGGRGQYRGPPVPVELPPAASEPELGRQLWAQSAQLVGLDYLDSTG